MESSYLLERKIISLCFNTIRDSVFILSRESDKLSLTEEDLTKNITLRRFRLLKKNECQIQNTIYRELPRETYEGYLLYFWELTQTIFVIYPFGYISIYDYKSGQLIYDFQCHGRKTYVIRNIVGSPNQASIFFSAKEMKNIYHINYENISKTGVTYQKLVLPREETVNDVICHPNEKFVFVACSDGIIHIFDYSDLSLAKIKEVKNGVVDIPLSPEDKIPKNQSELIKKNNLTGITTIDINITGNFLLSGDESGNVFLWDAFLAIKEKRYLINKERLGMTGILSLKFLKTKQFHNLERFACLVKDGKIYIYSIISKEGQNMTIPGSSPSTVKSYIFNRLYESTISNPIIYPLGQYNIITSNFINLSYFTNVISLTWPIMNIEKVKNGDKLEKYLLFTNFAAKFFFLYDNDFPKINLPLSSQMSFRSYEDYIPSSKKTVSFENKIYMIDNYFIWVYEVLTGNTKKLINYPKEFNFKNVYPLKFEVKITDNKEFFFVLIENELDKKYGLMIEYDPFLSMIKQTKKFDDIIDMILLGNNIIGKDYLLTIARDKQNAILYSISTGITQKKPIDASIVRVYNTPYTDGLCVLYRNVLDELKFSGNLIDEDKMKFKCINDNQYKLDFSEREIDVVFHKYEERLYCAISMIEKIIILDEKMKVLYTFKTSLNENPNIISSLFWIGNTLLYTKGNSLNYIYGPDNINQKLFTNNRSNTFIAGALSDRCLLVSKGGKDIVNVILTTPMLVLLEPILIGYLDSSSIDYNLIKECVVNMFTNQISQNLIDKFIKKDLKEVAWMFISDSKSSFQNIKKKIQILNDSLQFDKVLENIITNKDMKNEMHLDELLWKFHYDQSVDYIKVLLKEEAKVLIQYGQFDKAIKIMELLGQYPLALNLLLISTSKEEYEKLRVIFQVKNCLSFSDNLLINNAFCLQYKQDQQNVSNLYNYNKVFDKYKGEFFLFGANQNKFTVESIQNIENKVNKKTSYITNIEKKIFTYGETSYRIYVDAYNKETGKIEPSAICLLVLQKIEQFYGTKNTLYDDGTKAHKSLKKPNFTDYNVPLTRLSAMTTLNDMNRINEVSNQIEEEDIDLDPNTNAEEISEGLYLSAYYHCDKGIGNIVEDITDNQNDGTLERTEPPKDQNQIGMTNYGEINEEENLWSKVLDEFEPLEYEDKWGRKSPGPHSIRFNKKYKTSLIIKPSPSLNHFNKKMTIEMWVKLNSFNVVLLSKDDFTLEIQNGQFKINYQGNLLQGDIIKEYNLPINHFVHIAISFKKTTKIVRVYVNCEEVITFPFSLEKIRSATELIFGKGELDAELTEIRIWNQEMPIGYLKENYKSPLPILAENKKKLRMKINKQEEGQSQQKKKFGFGGANPFVFGGERMSSIRQSNESNKNIYEFNTGDFGGNEIDSSVSYPSLSSVIYDTRSVNSIAQNKNEQNKNQEQNFQFGFKFDEVNNQNFDSNVGDNVGGMDNFNFQVNDDFNFNK